jgi:hypothetical protein
MKPVTSSISLQPAANAAAAVETSVVVYLAWDGYSEAIALCAFGWLDSNSSGWAVGDDCAQRAGVKGGPCACRCSHVASLSGA